MASKMIDGKAVSAAYKEKLKKDIDVLRAQGITPGLAVVLVGEDAASKVYVGRKTKMCEELGMHSEQHSLPAETTEAQLVELIEKLAADSAIHGILVQLPLPKHIDEQKILLAIPPHKDVDAFHPENVGAIMIGDYSFLPCTPAGIVELIDSTGVDISGKSCVVVGRSNIVGKPMAMLLLHRNGTVTICHSRTQNLAEICRGADILVAAIGRANFITGEMIKPGAVVIDVGMNRTDDGKLCGDVDFESAKEVAGWLTPVPGGVGPMTITMLMRNTVTAARATSVN